MPNHHVALMPLADMIGAIFLHHPGIPPSHIFPEALYAQKG